MKEECTRLLFVIQGIFLNQSLLEALGIAGSHGCLRSQGTLAVSGRLEVFRKAAAKISMRIYTNRYVYIYI